MTVPSEIEQKVFDFGHTPPNESTQQADLKYIKTKGIIFAIDGYRFIIA